MLIAVRRHSERERRGERERERERERESTLPRFISRYTPTESNERGATCNEKANDRTDDFFIRQL